jgi:small subunit ribosomal protein S8
MSMTDPIADMLIRHPQRPDGRAYGTVMPASKLKSVDRQVLKDEGYIEDFAVREKRESGGHKELAIALKYYAGKPVIERLERVSKPGLRVYKGRDDIPRVMNGLGVAILSTSRGVMTDRKARADGVGGEVLCIVA